MKRIVCGLVAVVLLFTLVGCNSTQTAPSVDEQTSLSTTAVMTTKRKTKATSQKRSTTTSVFAKTSVTAASTKRRPAATSVLINKTSKSTKATTTTKTYKVHRLLKEKNGKLYLVLPISKFEVSIRDEYKQYLDKIDPDLLEKAESKISAQVQQYEKKSAFYLSQKNGDVYLSTEVIVQLDPPVTQPVGDDRYISKDHEHKFFSEKISK